MSTNQNWTDFLNNYDKKNTEENKTALNDNKSEPPKDNENEQKKKKRLILIISSIIIALILLGGTSYGIYSAIKDFRENKTETTIPFIEKERINTMTLIRRYIEKGEYDRAMDLLDSLLIKNADDQEALDIMDEIIALKEGSSSKDLQRQNQGVTLNTDDLAAGIRDAIQSSLGNSSSGGITGNSATMNELLKEQKQQTEETTAMRQAEEQRAAEQKAAEEKRQAEIARQKAEEEKRIAEEKAKAEKDKALKELMDKIKDEVSLGKVAASTGDYENAIKHFDTAKSMLPQEQKVFSAEQMADAALVLRDIYDTASAEEKKDPSFKENTAKAANNYANTALQYNPKNAIAHYILGKDAQESKDLNKALDEYTKAVQADSNNYLYYFELGKVQHSLKKYSEARVSFETSIKCKSDFAPAYYNLGITLSRLGRRDDAISSFRRAYTIDPLYTKAYLMVARLLKDKEDIKGSIAAYNEALKIDSANTDALKGLGAVYLSTKQYTEAEQNFRKALSISPDDAITNYNLSITLYGQGKTEEGVSYAAKAYQADKVNKQNVSIVYNYALLLNEIGKIEESIPIYQEALKLNPNHVRTLINLGVIFLDSEDSQTALAMFKKAAAIEPDNFEVNNNLANAYLAQKNYSEAIAYFQKALKIDSKNNAVRVNLARAYATSEDYTNAKIIYLDVLKADNQNWDAYIELAKVCMSLGENELAEGYLIHLQENNPGYKAQEVNNLLSSL